MSSMPLSTANWHWKNKNVTPWGRSWFERELTMIEVADGGDVVAISEVTDVEGDIELGQRKSKLITIYDCAIEMKWKGTASDGTEVSGNLKVPEVSHEITLDGLSDYAYNWTLSTESSAAVDRLFTFAKKRLPTALEAKFAEFAVVLVDTHGKDLQIGGTPTPSGEPSRTGTPVSAPVPAASSSASATPAPKVVKAEKKSLNTSKVEVESSFMASGDDLFQMLTDESKIPMWTRASAQSKPEPGAPFSLFGGGVKGTFVSLDRPKQFVQRWALSNPSWPSEHFATLTTTFDQSSDSTKLTLSLEGVPKGMEDEIKRNMEGYYIQGLKSIGPAANKTEEPESGGNSSRAIAIALAALVLVGAFALPYFQK